MSQKIVFPVRRNHENEVCLSRLTNPDMPFLEWGPPLQAQVEVGKDRHIKTSINMILKIIFRKSMKLIS